MDGQKYGSCRKSRRRQSGSSLVEFSLVVVPLMLLLFGIIQFGFIFAAYMTVRNATVITARWANLQVTPPRTVDDIKAFAKLQVQPMLNPNNVTAVNVSQTNVTSGVTNTSVEIQYNLRLIIPWVVHGSNAPNTYLVKATSIMR
ncbi:MAG TPA: TadE family protein [Verrucomicrobiae bacterium]|nr:TadE family protein [Verrucomicrobiae bacterium]